MDIVFSLLATTYTVYIFLIVFAQPFESDKKLNTGAAMQSIHLEVAELAMTLSQISPR